jgi:hypothetical protein
LRWGFFFVCCLGSDCHALIRETASPLLQEKAAKQFPGRCQASNKERPRAKAWGLFLFHVSAVTYSSTDGLRHEQGIYFARNESHSLLIAGPAEMPAMGGLD